MEDLFFRELSGGLFLSKIWSVIYRRNREKTSFPILQSVFVQVSAAGRYKQFFDFCIFMVKCEIQLLQLKLQLGIMIFHHSKTSTASFKVIWWVLIVDEVVIVFDNSAVEFHGKGNLTWWNQTSGTWVQICDDLLIFQGDICIEDVSDILSHWLQGRWEKISFSYSICEDFSVGQMSPTDHSSTDFFFFICFSSTLCTGSQFLEFVRPQGWLQF